MKNTIISRTFALLWVFIIGVGGFVPQLLAQKYTLVTSADELIPDDHYRYIFVFNRTSDSYAMSKNAGSNYREATKVTVKNQEIDLTGNSEVCPFILGGSDNAWTFYDENLQKYLTASQENLISTSEIGNNSKARIQFKDNAGTLLINFVSNTINRYLKYTTGTSKTFIVSNSYEGNTNIQIYRHRIITGTQPTELSYDVDTLNVTYGEGYKTPQLNNPNGLAVYYESSNTSVASINKDSGKLSLRNNTGTTTISAIYEGDDTFLPDTVSYTLNVTASLSAAGLFYKEVTQKDELLVGGQYIIVCEKAGVALGDDLSNGKGSRQAVDILDGNTIIISNITSKPLELTLTSQLGSGNYRFRLANGTGKYFASETSGTNLTTISNANSQSEWIVTFNDDNTRLQTKEHKNNSISYSPDNQYFKYYSSYNTDSYFATQLYRKVGRFELSEKVNCYGTYYTDFNYQMPEGVVGYAIYEEGLAEGALTPELAYQAKENVASGSALLLKSENAGTFYPAVIVLEDKVKAFEKAGDNLLKGTRNSENYTETEGDMLYYKLTTLEGNYPGFYWGAEEGGPFVLKKETSAYLAIPKIKASQGFRIDFFTGIEETHISPSTQQDIIYHLSGQRIFAPFEQLPRGVYIVNGKRILVK